MNSVKMYAAYGRRSSSQEWSHITLAGQVFFTEKAMMTEMVEAMQKKHPIAEFKIEEVK